MRYIDLALIDKKDPDVIGWLNKARLYLNELSKKTTHDERKEYMAAHGIWSQFKPILIKYYGEKCWYSECSLEGTFGEIDHFRPKNKSTDEKKNEILPDGYWWLAYDYLNYRLSCEKSNRSYGDGGKNDMFPLKAGTPAATQGNNNDIPILLDPCVESDVEIIDCNEAGEIIALSNDPYDVSRVEISKRIYNWNCFNIGRKKIRSDSKIALQLFEMAYELCPDKMAPSIKQICKLVHPDTPYSSFAKRYIKFKIHDKPYEDVIVNAIEEAHFLLRHLEQREKQERLPQTPCLEQEEK